MASVSGTSGSSYSSLSSQIRGYGGLASGLDRDTLIEQMTSGTRAKIAKQKQEQTKIEWKQEAMRDITSKIYNFTSNYTSYASGNNLLSSNLFSRNQITAVGENSKYISVSGTAASAENMSIAGIKQLAKNASLITNTLTDQKLKTADLGLGANGELSESKTVSTIAGDSIYFKYGTQRYTLKLLDTDDYDYSTPEKAMEAINEQLKNINVGSGVNAQTLGDIIKVEMDGDKVKFSVNESNAHGNTVQLAGGTGNILEDLGFLRKGENFSDWTDDDRTITGEGLTGSLDAKLTEEKTLAQRLSGAEINFSYNGTAKTITLDNYSQDDKIDNVVADMQKKLEAAFGKGRIQVVAEMQDGKLTGKLTFNTVKPPKGEADNSSVLAVTGGTGIVGKNGAFGIMAGSSNRLNMSANLENAGFGDKTAEAIKAHEKDGKYTLKINDKEVEGITKDSTIKEIVDKINSTEGIGVSVAYQEMSNRFVVTATENGASGTIKFGDDPDNIAKYLFGNLIKGETDAVKGDTATMPGFTYTMGQDAILSVKYPGSEKPIEITRGSNVVSLDGLNVTLKGKFGYNGDNIDPTAEAITFNAEVDADKTVEAVKGMIDSFNEILALVNTDVKTKPNRDYAPLTDEQKAEMSETQIEQWEAKAKEGILFADMDLRMMADNLRTIINSGNTTELSGIGITTSTNYADNGKLVFDEEKFRTALQKDSEAVRQIFTRTASKDENGNTVQGGLMVAMKGVMDKYGSMTGATKGILVERAGSIYAPTTVLKNSYQKQLDSLSDYISRLQDKLETETDRYISQFTSLETLISQMNSQSSYLSSLFA